MSEERVAPPTIAGLRYVRQLGEGGQAIVHEYEQALPRRRVAVKVLKDAVGSPDLRATFLHEAHVMAQLEHPFIVPVYAAGVTDDGRPYLVMQRFADESLLTASSRHRLSVPDVLRIGVQVGGAVATAHAAGILHRDIKPQNILINDRGTPALSDFGISSRITLASPSPSYSLPWAPPEALHPAGVLTVVSDVYSLGATVWHLLAGHSPFVAPDSAPDLAGLADRVQHMPAPPTGRPDVPPSLEALLSSAMAKDPARRPPTVFHFVEGLRAVERELGLPPTEPFMPAIPIGVAQLEPTATRAGLAADATLVQNAGRTTPMPPASPIPTPVLPGSATRYPTPRNRTLLVVGLVAAAGLACGVGAAALVMTRPPTGMTEVSTPTPHPLALAPSASTAPAPQATATSAPQATATSAPPANVSPPTVVVVAGPTKTVTQAPQYPTVKVPAGSKECYRDPSGGPYAAVGTANSTTSCPFAVNVREEYLAAGMWGRPGVIYAYSPTTKKEYEMTCSGSQPVLCTGGVAGRVLIYGGVLVAG